MRNVFIGEISGGCILLDAKQRKICGPFRAGMLICMKRSPGLEWNGQLGDDYATPEQKGSLIRVSVKSHSTFSLFTQPRPLRSLPMPAAGQAASDDANGTCALPWRLARERGWGLGRRLNGATIHNTGAE